MRYTKHVPIRFRAEVIQQVKEIAERDGLTVSSWIRRLVERELERQTPTPPPGTYTSGEGANWTWDGRP
jgi:DNA-binding protein H-NS